MNANSTKLVLNEDKSMNLRLCLKEATYFDLTREHDNYSRDTSIEEIVLK